VNGLGGAGWLGRYLAKKVDQQVVDAPRLVVMHPVRCIGLLQVEWTKSATGSVSSFRAPFVQRLERR
jgi:hypothetical protein